VNWLWIQEDYESRELWGQEEFATKFVLDVLNFIPQELVTGAELESFVHDILIRLSNLQALYQGFTDWVEDERLFVRLRRALRLAILGINRDNIAEGDPMVL
jgi:hypothetical protein